MADYNTLQEYLPLFLDEMHAFESFEWAHPNREAHSESGSYFYLYVRPLEQPLIGLRSTTCCGLMELFSLAKTAKLSPLLQEMVLTECAHYARGYCNKGMLFATTVGEESPSSRMLARYSFTRTTDFYNPNSGNVVIHWQRRISKHDLPSWTDLLKAAHEAMETLKAKATARVEVAPVEPSMPTRMVTPRVSVAEAVQNYYAPAAQQVMARMHGGRPRGWALHDLEIPRPASEAPAPADPAAGNPGGGILRG